MYARYVAFLKVLTPGDLDLWPVDLKIGTSNYSCPRGTFTPILIILFCFRLQAPVLDRLTDGQASCVMRPIARPHNKRCGVWNSFNLHFASSLTSVYADVIHCLFVSYEHPGHKIGEMRKEHSGKLSQQHPHICSDSDPRQHSSVFSLKPAVVSHFIGQCHFIMQLKWPLNKKNSKFGCPNSILRLSHACL